MARLALVVIAWHMWQTDAARGADRFVAWPSVDRLAQAMGVSLATAKRATAELRDLNLVVAERGGRRTHTVKGKSVRTTVYRLGPEAMAFIERTWPNPVTGTPALRLARTGSTAHG